jgi:hypothetical protein
VMSSMKNICHFLFIFNLFCHPSVIGCSLYNVGFIEHLAVSQFTCL